MRFAVVMYGGVSLAIYINGVVQELFRLVRATAPDAAGTTLAVSDAELTPLERVYREIGRRRLSETEWNPGELDPATDGVSSRFVVDILSGTSAGGINAIVFGKAIANGLPSIDALKRLWIEDAEIDKLLNEPQAYADLIGVAYKAPPESLLAGDRLLAQARQALGDMGDGRSDDAPHYADQLDLAVTMTDLQGLWLPIRLADATVEEPRHRAALRFVYATQKATGEERNDFDGTDRLLAFAARATSSFPFAFSPVTLHDVAPEPTDEEQRFFADWAQLSADFGDYAFADGGYLQNKPFTYATDTLRRRRADRPVDRKLLYLEPDPDVLPADHAVAQARPDALANTQAALIGLPRAQPIRDDLAAILERNDAIERAEEVTRDLAPLILGPDEPAEAPAALIAVYHRLRRASVADALTDVVVRACALAPYGDQAAAIRLLLSARAGEGPGTSARYLERLDLGYRLRRLNYLQDRINDLLEGGRRAATLLHAAALDTESLNTPAFAPWLHAVKMSINERFTTLRTTGRLIRADRDGGTQPIIEAASAVAGICTSGFSREVLSKADPLYAAAETLANHAVYDVINDLVDAVADQLEGAFEADASTDLSQLQLDSLPSAAGLATLLQRAFERTQLLDMALLPLTWPGLGETRSVAIHRISPHDAPSLIAMPVTGQDGQPTGRRRLAGAALGHFGGFLDEGWRRNDMLWGRLDAAERLIAVLSHADAREQLRVRAQAAILREEYTTDESGTLLDLLTPAERELFESLLAPQADDAALVACFVDAYRGPSGLDAARQVGLAGRAINVTGGVLSSIERGQQLLRRPSFWLSRVGRLLWGFAELAVPAEGTRVTSNARRHLPQLALLVGGLLVLAGALAGIDGAQGTGWLLVGAVASIMIVRWLLQGRPRKVGVAVCVALAVMGFAAVEAVRHLVDDLNALHDWLPLV